MVLEMIFWYRWDCIRVQRKTALFITELEVLSREMRSKKAFEKVLK